MKTVTLRLDDDVVKALDALQVFYRETTTNKTAARVIQLHKKLHQDNEALKIKVRDIQHDYDNLLSAVNRFKNAQKELLAFKP